MSAYDDAFVTRFIHEYLKDLNATQAAIRAGADVKQPAVVGSRLMSREDIQQRIAEANAARLQDIKVEASTVLRELLAMGTLDIGAAYDETGCLKSIHEIPLEVRKAIAAIDTEELYEGHGKDRKWIGTVKKVKLWDRGRALEMLGRHIQLFKDSLALTGADGGPLRVIDDTERQAKIDAIYAAAARRRALADGPPDGSDLV